MALQTSGSPRVSSFLWGAARCKRPCWSHTDIPKQRRDYDTMETKITQTAKCTERKLRRRSSDGHLDGWVSHGVTYPDRSATNGRRHVTVVKLGHGTSFIFSRKLKESLTIHKDRSTHMYIHKLLIVINKALKS